MSGCAHPPIWERSLQDTSLKEVRTEPKTKFYLGEVLGGVPHLPGFGTSGRLESSERKGTIFPL